MDNQNQFNLVEELGNLTPDNNEIDNLSISNSGQYIAIESYANSNTDILIYDRLNQTTESILDILIKDENSADSHYLDNPLISEDGNYITFSSSSDALVPNDDNDSRDVFIYDRSNQTVELIEIAIEGTQAGDKYSSVESISSNGQYITFESDFYHSATDEDEDSVYGNPSDVFLYDRLSQTTELISPSLDGFGYDNSSVSNDGRYVAYETYNELDPDQDFGLGNITVYDRLNQTTQLVDVSTDGVKANAGSSHPIISGDGRYVAFQSNADNLVPNDTNGERDIFVRDLVNQTTEIVSIASDGTLSNGRSYSASISDDGKYVSFKSRGNNLVPNDTNENTSSFVYDRDTDTIELVSLAADGTEFDDSSEEIALSGDGQHIAFSIGEDNPELYVRSRQSLDMNRFTTDEVHRFFEERKGFHLYTVDDNEINQIKEKSATGELFYKYESEKFNVLANDLDALTGETLEGVKPVYRFFNRETGSHLYTMDDNEKNIIQNTLDNYNFEGIKYYAFESEPENIETIPVFRMLNNQSGSHLFTIDSNEIQNIQANLPHFSLENDGNAAFHVFEL